MQLLCYVHMIVWRTALFLFQYITKKWLKEDSLTNKKCEHIFIETS
jgi:hypothetical protein